MLTVFMVTVFPVRSIGKVYALFPMLRRADQIHVFDHAVGAIFVTAVLLTRACKVPTPRTCGSQWFGIHVGQRVCLVCCGSQIRLPNSPVLQLSYG
jgi:hypothetical protein